MSSVAAAQEQQLDQRWHLYDFVPDVLRRTSLVLVCPYLRLCHIWNEWHFDSVNQI